MSNKTKGLKFNQVQFYDNDGDKPYFLDLTTKGDGWESSWEQATTLNKQLSTLMSNLTGLLVIKKRLENLSKKKWNR